VKLALVTAATSGIGDLARRLVPHLASRAELRVFLEQGSAGAELEGAPTEPVAALLPREHDQVLYLVANEAGCGFMAETVRLLGGAVVLRDWELPELALAAYPALRARGPAGFLRAAREGGLGQARQWARSLAGDPEGAPALNRSIVRFADAFIVAEGDVRERILVERNAPTPVAVMEPSDPAETAEQYLDVLDRFPRPRSINKRLLVRRIRGELARR
jgi:hypothetical protein